MMYSERTYWASKALLLNIIWDMAELQHGNRTIDDLDAGKVGFITTMYGIEHEYRFTVSEGEAGCVVRIEVVGDGKLIPGAFALLESLLGIGPVGSSPGRLS
ncbi:MAG: hypothetical protein GXY32_07620 [Ruminococcaceae bacterium]|nr:hypothetical protein [Oscillospiraceae bacterium]